MFQTWTLYLTKLKKMPIGYHRSISTVFHCDGNNQLIAVHTSSSWVGLSSHTPSLQVLLQLVNDHVSPKIFPVGNYMFKVNNRNTRTRCEICSNLTITRPERIRRLILPTKVLTFLLPLWSLLTFHLLLGYCWLSAKAKTNLWMTEAYLRSWQASMM